MTCYRPLHGYRAKTVNKSGKRSITFKMSEAFRDLPVTVPCGTCIGCLTDRSQAWAIRCVHESKLYKQNSFVTLTYNDENLPLYGSLVKKDFQQFIKNLRQKIAPNRFRYFHAGEYGNEKNRPHYHALLFNLDFMDRKLYTENNGVKLYTSEFLHSVWKKGFCTVGDLTLKTAAYTARYTIKKHSRTEEYYHIEGNILDESNIIVHRLQQEYCTMSRRPGIGQKHFEKYNNEIYPDDFVVSEGRKKSVPKYYDNQYEILNKNKYKSIKIKRKYKASLNAENNTQQRLDVRERIKQKKINLLLRKL